VTPNNKLFPAPNRERIEVKRWEALADGICDAAAPPFLEAKRPKRSKAPTGLPVSAKKSCAAWNSWPMELGEKPFCMGTHFSMADIAVGTALGYLAFRFADINWQESHPNLASSTPN
jgi:glutathione S-transferase